MSTITKIFNPVPRLAYSNKNTAISLLFEKRVQRYAMIVVEVSKLDPSLLTVWYTIFLKSLNEYLLPNGIRGHYSTDLKV